MTKQILKLTKQGDKFITEELELSPREKEIVSAYLKLRNHYFLLHKMEEEDNENTPGIRSELNDFYNDFVQIFGNLNKTRNKNILAIDPYSFLILASLEVKMGNVYEKATVLTRSPKGEIEVFRSENCIEALSYCLGIYGKVDLKIIEGITDKDEEEIIRELSELIYYDPIEDCWTTADKWLSGNVYTKMINTKEILDTLSTKSIEEEVVEEQKEEIEIPMGKYTHPKPYKSGK